MALIKCSNCGKEISDKAKACPHCGHTFKKEGTNEMLKKIYKNIENTDSKKTQIIRFFGSLLLSVFMFPLISILTFNNFLIAIIVSIIYCAFVFGVYEGVYKYSIKNMNGFNTLFKSLIICSVCAPFIIVLCLIINNESWSYNNFSSYNSDMEYYSFNLNVFGQCSYYYSNLEKDITKTSSKCSYEKNGDKYTFYMTDKETQEKTSFDCRLSNGELKCPLRYTYPTEYIYLEKN